MRALLEDVRFGELTVCHIPPPELRNGGILVQTHFSAISSGTERAKVEAGKRTLLGKALSRPDLVHQVIEFARNNGLLAAYRKVQARLEALSYLGYSCSGVVLEVGEGAGEFQPGDRVACGGVGYANHSEINFVPLNLAVHVPPSIPLDQAAITTIGAIALHSLRQSEAGLGDTVAIIGVGLVGMLTLQLARAAGCRVIAIDIDPQRAAQAASYGAHLGLVATDGRLLECAKEVSPAGADVAIITAASQSSEPVELATRLLRDRGRIVIVGDVGLGVSRRMLYEKELSLVLSRSYGPGRYDPQYEEQGVDYPIGYVRWTERRNMEAFLQTLAEGAVKVAPLLQPRYPIEEATKAYDDLGKTGAYTALIEYPVLPVQQPEAVNASQGQNTRVLARGELRVSCIGAGGFARDVIFPHLRDAKGVILDSVATASGVAAESARRTFGFSRAAQPTEVLQSDHSDLIFVLSRHDSHADYVLGALHSQRPVFVEKPLATDPEQLSKIEQVYRTLEQNGAAPFLMVGFNRRFAPFTDEMRNFFSNRGEPMLVHIRANSGYIPRDHWTQTESNGGRIVGELCHFVDWARYMVNAPITRVWAAALPDNRQYNRDNVSCVIAFHDGSLANLLYLANGDKALPKEYLEVFCQGSVARLDDFRRLDLMRGGRIRSRSGKRDKGHRRELELTLDAVRTGAASPISFGELLEVTRVCFAIRESIQRGLPVNLNEPERVHSDGERSMETHLAGVPAQGPGEAAESSATRSHRKVFL